MKAAIRYLAPPCAFVIFAFLASHRDPAFDDSMAPEGAGIRQPTGSPSSTQDPVGVTVALARLERNIIHSKAVPVKSHDAAGMDSALDADERNAGFVCGGMGATTYAMEWADEAPEEMLAWLILQDATFNSRCLSPTSILFETWSGKNMSVSLEAVPKIPDSKIRAQALASTLENLYPKDPQRALEILNQNLDLFPPGSDNSPFRPYGTGTTTCDMLLALPASPERIHLLAGMLSQLASWSMDGTVAKAIKVWNGASEVLRRDLVDSGFSGKAGESFEGLPELVREHAETTGDTESAAEFIRTHGGEWAERDLPAAFGWTQEHLKGKERVERGAALFKDAAAKDFDGALATWKELPEGFLKAKALAAIQEGTPAGRESDFKELIEAFSDEERKCLR